MSRAEAKARKKAALRSGRADRESSSMLVKARGDQLDEITRDLLLDLADHLFPGVERLDELPDEQRRWWILLQTKLIQANQQDRDSIRLVLQGVDEDVWAEIHEFLAKAEGREAESSGLRGRLEERRETTLRERAKQRSEQRTASRSQLLPPPPSTPIYDRAFGNQLRWASHVIRYALQQRRLKSASPESK